MTEIRTCLWFEDQAEEAAALYTALVPGSRIERIDRPGAEAPAILVHLSLGGAPFSLLNGGVRMEHSAAASIVVVTDDQAGTDALWQAHLDAGSAPDRCGWIADRWGVRWQVFPRGLNDVMFQPDPAASARVYQALLTQVKIDLAALQAAARGE